MKTGHHRVGQQTLELHGANALELAELVRAKMEELKRRFPEGLDYRIPYDTTLFVKASIEEVYETLFIAVILVVIVIFQHDIRRALEARKEYSALPISETVGRKAVEIAMTLGKTIDTFQDYVEFTRETVSEHHKQKKEERYRAKIEHFLDEIDGLRKE